MNVELDACKYCGGLPLITDMEYAGEYDRIVIQCPRCGITLDRRQDFLMVQ